MQKIKKLTLSLLIIVAMFLCSCGLLDFSSTGSKDSNDFSVTNLSLDVSSSYIGYDAYVNGTLKNNSSKNYSYVQIEFSIYDENGNNLGTAMDNINNLASGDTWQFRAILLSTPSTRPKTAKLVDINAW